MATQRTIHENSYGFFFRCHFDFDEYIFYIHIQHPHVSCIQRNKSETQTAHVFAGFMRRLTNRFKCCRSLIRVCVCERAFCERSCEERTERKTLCRRERADVISTRCSTKKNYFSKYGRWTLDSYRLRGITFYTIQHEQNLFDCFLPTRCGWICTVVMCVLCTNTLETPDEQPV